MNTKILSNIAHNLGAEMAKGAKKLGKSAAQAGSAVKSGTPKKPISPGQRRSSAPMSTRELAQRGVIMLLVLICCISVIFASCAKAPAETPKSDDTPIESLAPSPEASFTPAL